MNQKAASNLSQIINPVDWDFENLDSESKIIKAATRASFLKEKLWMKITVQS